VSKEVLSQIDWDNPQFSHHFKLVHSLRTKIERLFSRMKHVQAWIQAWNRQNPRAHIEIYESNAYPRQPPAPASGGWGDICSIKPETKKRVDSKNGKQAEG